MGQHLFRMATLVHSDHHGAVSYYEGMHQRRFSSRDCAGWRTKRSSLTLSKKSFRNRWLQAAHKNKLVLRNLIERDVFVTRFRQAAFRYSRYNTTIVVLRHILSES